MLLTMSCGRRKDGKFKSSQSELSKQRDAFLLTMIRVGLAVDACLALANP